MNNTNAQATSVCGDAITGSYTITGKKGQGPITSNAEEYKDTVLIIDHEKTSRRF